MKAIQIETFGSPAEVVKVVDVPDVGAPAAREVVIALEASPINQYDLLMIAGGYGYRPRLPAIMATEGAGRVVAVGASIVMSPEDMVDAALAGLDQGELVTIPGLHDGNEWTRFEAARRAISKRFGNSVPAPRYRIAAPAPADRTR
jgi:NADPH:quinone reductase-like Zn-dependent oxidoreductase